MARQIVSYLKDRNERKYKIEEQSINDFFSTNYLYHVLYDDGTLKYKNFKSKNEAIRYLEEQVGHCSQY